MIGGENMSIFKKLFHLKPKKIEQEPSQKEECWYNNIHEQGENRNVPPMDAVGVNQFECGQTKNSASH